MPTAKGKVKEVVGWGVIRFDKRLVERKFGVIPFIPIYKTKQDAEYMEVIEGRKAVKVKITEKRKE